MLVKFLFLLTVVEVAAQMLSRITFVSSSHHFLHKQCDDCTYRTGQSEYNALPEGGASYNSCTGSNSHSG